MASCKTLWLTAAMLLTVLQSGTPAGEPQRLTDDGTLKFAPCFVQDGEAIVFATHNLPNRVSLFKLQLADGSQELLYPSMADHQLDPAYSADGRYHCFSKSSGSPQLLLVIKDLQDQTEAVFAPQGARSTARGARFLPDGSRIVFTLSQPGGQQIASVDARAGDLRMLTQSTGINCSPSVSPDGRHIAFSSSRDGFFSIYVMTVDGDDVRRLTLSGVRDMRPAWSLDGQWIAFTSARDGNYEIYVIKRDGSNLRKITDHPERDDYAAWHPRGRQILTVSQRDGRYDLYLFDLPELD